MLCIFMLFQLDKNFGSNYKLPQFARQLIFELADSTDLQIQTGLMADASINQLTVRGPRNHRGQVEILENAFKDNRGPFPDIRLVNVNTIVLHERGFKGEFKLNVTNSESVHILKDTFRSTRLDGNFRNIKDLRIAEGSFINSSATVGCLCFFCFTWFVQRILRDYKGKIFYN